MRFVVMSPSRRLQPRCESRRRAPALSSPIILVTLEALALALAVPASARPEGFGFYEAKALAPAASFVAGKRAVVLCAPSEQRWQAFLDATGDAGVIAAGSTVPGSNDTKLPPLICRTLAGYLSGRHERLDYLALSILTLVHEAFHMRGEWNEGEADCNAFREMPRIAVAFFHVPSGGELRALMAQASTWRDDEPLWYRTYC